MKQIKVICATCKSLNKHTVIHSEKKNESDDDIPFYSSTEYQIIQCNGCEGFSFRKTYGDNEMIDHETGDNYSTEVIYPHRTLETIEKTMYYMTPPRIVDIMSETVDAFNNNQLILCAAGVRATIEALCIEQNIEFGMVPKKDKTGKHVFDAAGEMEYKKSKDLEGKINGLAEKQILTKKNAAILHHHRFLGNDAVHKVEKPSVDKLKIALEIIEHTLYNVYEIDIKAYRMGRKRSF